MQRFNTTGRRVLGIAAVVFGSVFCMNTQAEAGWPYGYRFGNYGGYGVGYRHASPYTSHYHGGHYDWHDTSHYDWHDTSHFHRVGPYLYLHRTGHWDFHPQGHWDYHGGHHHH